MIRLFSSDGQEIKFESTYFPGGEPHVHLWNEPESEPIVTIDARITDARELVLLLVLTDALRNNGVDRIRLYLPYFPGARQDRVDLGGALTARVVADLINSQGYEKVTVLDPHSVVTPALLNNCSVPPLHVPIGFCPGILGVICPDSGAVRRAQLAAISYKVPVVYARKNRCPRTGRILGFSIDQLPAAGNYLVVDDICDGGATFLRLADKFREDINGTGSLYLWVTHGIFSNGLDDLTQHLVFDKIGCTDSFPTERLRDERLSVFSLNKPISGIKYAGAYGV